MDFVLIWNIYLRKGRSNEFLNSAGPPGSIASILTQSNSLNMARTTSEKQNLITSQGKKNGFKDEVKIKNRGPSSNFLYTQFIDVIATSFGV